MLSSRHAQSSSTWPLLQAADIRILQEELRQAQLHTSQLDTELHTQRMETSASQQAKQAPPDTSVSESGNMEQGRVGFIMASQPHSSLVCNLMCLLLCSCKCLSFCRSHTRFRQNVMAKMQAYLQTVHMQSGIHLDSSTICTG